MPPPSLTTAGRLLKHEVAELFADVFTEAKVRRYLSQRPFLRGRARCWRRSACTRASNPTTQAAAEADMGVTAPKLRWGFERGSALNAPLRRPPTLKGPDDPQVAGHGVEVELHEALSHGEPQGSLVDMELT